MMKALTACVLACLYSVSLEAQTGEVTITDRPFGWNKVQNREIAGREILFQQTIDRVRFDELDKQVTVRLRNLNRKGKHIDSNENTVVFDLTKMRVKWYKEDILTTSYLLQSGDYFFHLFDNHSVLLNRENGRKIWSIKTQMLHADDSLKIGLGCTSGFEDLLQGIDLSNGSVLWERPISIKYGLNDLFYLNDSTVMLVANGIHTIRLRDGSGWSYSTPTGELHNETAVVLNLVRLVALMVDGTYIIGSANPQLIFNIASNVLIDSSGYYFAGKECISHLSYSGQELWSRILPEEKTSESDLIKWGRNLLLVNRGYAYRNQIRIHFGSPFIAAYDPEIGKKLIWQVWEEPDLEISDYQLMGDTLVILFEDRLVVFDLKNNRRILEHKPELQKNKMKSLIDQKIIINQHSVYKPLSLSGIGVYYIQLENDDILCLNERMEVVKRLAPDAYYTCFLEDNDKRFLACGNKTIVVNSEQQIIASLDISSRTYKIGSSIYCVMHKSILEVKLNDVE